MRIGLIVPSSNTVMERAQQTGAKAVTVLRAVLTQLRALQPQRLAVFTPYIEDLTDSVARCLAEAGFPPLKAAGMGIRANLEIGCVTPAEIVSFVEYQIAGTIPDCIFLSCTNWRAIEVVEPLKKKLGIPIITSNQAAIDVLRRAL